MYFTHQHWICTLFTPPQLFTLSYLDSNFWSVTNWIYRLYVSWERLSLILEETQCISLLEIDLSASQGESRGHKDAVAQRKPQWEYPIFWPQKRGSMKSVTDKAKISSQEPLWIVFRYSSSLIRVVSRLKSITFYFLVISFGHTLFFFLLLSLVGSGRLLLELSGSQLRT